MNKNVADWFVNSIQDKAQDVLIIDRKNSIVISALKENQFQKIYHIFLDDDGVMKIYLNDQLSDEIILNDNLTQLLEYTFANAFFTDEILRFKNVRSAINILRFTVQKFIFYSLNLNSISNWNQLNKIAISDIISGMRLPGKAEISNENNQLMGLLSCGQSRSQLRQGCDKFMKMASAIINSDLLEGKLLYVGTAGDPEGGEYTSFFPSFDTVTADVDPIWKPDVICDITKTDFEDQYWDVVVVSNVIEHIPDIRNLSDEIARIIKPNGYFLVDCPWNFPYHAEPPSFGDFWRISLDGFNQLFGNSFSPICLEQNELSSHALYKRH